MPERDLVYIGAQFMDQSASHSMSHAAGNGVVTSDILKADIAKIASEEYVHEGKKARTHIRRSGL